MPVLNIELIGAETLIAKLRAAGSAARPVVDNAVEATAETVKNIARQEAPKDTTALANSIVIRSGMEGTLTREVFTNKEYAARMNWGFVGTDSLGRTYNQPGYYYMSIAAARGARVLRNNVSDAVEDLL